MPTVLQDSQKLVFIGDSITDCNRRDAAFFPLGNGYVHFFADFLAIREPSKSVAILNRGVGGNTVEDLRSRWRDDVLDHRPDWVCVKIGINDLNRHLCGPDAPLFAPPSYESIYRGLLASVRRELPCCQILLISPFYISRDNLKESYRARVLEQLPSYINVVQKLHQEFQTRYLDLQDRFLAQLKHHHPDAFGLEPVHPNQRGHLLIAEAIYEALS